MYGEYQDVCIWADGTACFIEEIDVYLDFMSDDYQTVPILLQANITDEEIIEVAIEIAAKY